MLKYLAKNPQRCVQIETFDAKLLTTWCIFVFCSRWHFYPSLLVSRSPIAQKERITSDESNL
jgi:hypothetical protein